jgi:hypothetical protein
MHSIPYVMTGELLVLRCAPVIVQLRALVAACWHARCTMVWVVLLAASGCQQPYNCGVYTRTLQCTVHACQAHVNAATPFQTAQQLVLHATGHAYL